jgi:UDPglucose 6-dehydrogenase
LRVSVIGLGYVGLVTSACLAEWGHQVVGTDKSSRRLGALAEGQTPFFEPGLDALVAKHLESGRFRITDSGDDAAGWGEIVIVAVGTHDGNGGWQTTTMQACLAEVIPAVRDGVPVVVRSTLPPSFIRQLMTLARVIRADANLQPVPVMLNPEFTREGNAIHDFMHPDRVIIGTADDPTGDGLARLRKLYSAVTSPILAMPAIDAAFAKLGSNLFLATKISFANEMAALCDGYGARIDNVIAAMSHDPRIGGQFLRAGAGFGGSCLPHQVTMTVRAAALDGIPSPLLSAVDEINHRQRTDIVSRVQAMLGALRGRRIALLGLTFKPNTDDLRDAPSLTVAEGFIREGATVIAYDPMAAARAAAAAAVPHLQHAESALEALRDANAAVLMTDWSEFAEIDWSLAAGLMRQPIVFDGRNVLSPEKLIAAGFSYSAFGRQATAEPRSAVTSIPPRSAVEPSAIGSLDAVAHQNFE